MHKCICGCRCMHADVDIPASPPCVYISQCQLELLQSMRPYAFGPVLQGLDAGLEACISLPGLHAFRHT